MHEKVDEETPAAPPHARLVQMATAHWVSHIVYVAAKLGLADQLGGGPKSADELARRTGTHAPSLYGLMRTLASLGILTEDATRRFDLAPVGEFLAYKLSAGINDDHFSCL
jgi:Dimerisation domain